MLNNTHQCKGKYKRDLVDCLHCLKVLIDSFLFLYSRTPVHNAAECDYLEVLKILVKSLEKPQKSEQGTESKEDGHQR